VDPDQAGITGGQNHRAALIADLFLRALYHAVAFASSTGTNLARGRHPKPLFGGGFGFHFGHFAFSFRALIFAAMACPYTGQATSNPTISVKLGG
jgi:hypothetical protein